MADIVLTALNAKYIHCAFGLRYLMANLGALRNHAVLLEFDIKRNPAEVVAAILSHEPGVIGFGVYVWNVKPLTEIITSLRRARPETAIVLGGPEVSFESEEQAICRLADYVIAGEGEFAFAALCERLLRGERPAQKLIYAEPVDLDRIAMPYDLYDEGDLAHRMIYVEASRGCPYRCEYCVSSHDVPVRFFKLTRLLPEFQQLLDRGARQFKFVDRTFNVNIEFAIAILAFFLERLRPGLFLHFEMVPERFPPELRDIVRRFPPGTLQFEVGVQTLNEEVAARIQRHMDAALLLENLRFLREETGVFVHADLIAGLPGESLESFAAGFERLVALRPQQIQVGILKRLRGAPIARHDAEWRMVYNAEPPYEIIENSLIARADMDRLKRLARFWELIANRGNFLESLPLILRERPFENFMRLSDGLFARFERDFGIPLNELAEEVFEHLTRDVGLDRQKTAEVIQRDYTRGGRRWPGRGGMGSARNGRPTSRRTAQ